MAVFGDLNVPWLSDTSGSDDRIRRAVEYGYETLAINYFLPELSVKTGKKEPKKVEEIPSPSRLLETSRNLTHNRKVSFYSRFSTVLSDAAQVIRIQKDPVIQSYDLLSLQPTTEKLFLSACKDLEIDIITLDFTCWLPFQLKHTAVGCAVERGVHFEIIYSPILRDATLIKNMIYNTMQLLDSSHGKNIIISSGCEKDFELRAPYSAMNLVTMLGLTEVQAKAAISLNCRSVLLHAAARKSAKGVLSIVKASTLTPGERWKIPTDPSMELEREEKEEENRDVSDEMPQRKKFKMDRNFLHNTC